MSTERDELIQALSILLADRGNFILDWPDDESNLYRKFSAVSYGTAMAEVQKLRHEKAADALITAGYSKPRTIDTAEELDELPGMEPETVTTEEYEYGRLWQEGTFARLGWIESVARDEFENKGYELKGVPVSLRPVFARRRVVTTKETYPAEATPEPTP